MRPSIPIRPLLPLSLGLLSSCSLLGVASQSDLEPIGVRLSVISQALDAQDRKIRRIVTHMMYCSTEVLTLIDRVTEQCSVAADSVCTLDSANILGELAELDPSQKGSFLSLMQDHKHVAFYGIGKKEGMSAVQKKQLRDLIKPALLDDGKRRTRFLVVSHPEDSRPGAQERATDRGRLVAAEIQALLGEGLELNVPSTIEPPPHGEVALLSTVVLPKPAEGGASMSAAATGEPAPPARPARPMVGGSNRVLQWMFHFSTKSDVLRSEDRPKQPGELLKSVWVFRVDC